MPQTGKRLSERDANQVLQAAGNETDASLTVSGFITARIGHRVTRTAQDSTTDDYSFYDNDTLLYTIRIVYNNSDHDEVDSAERIA